MVQKTAAETPQQTRRFGYLPQLDGLRAIAIAAVVGFHVGFPYMVGGYVGVDIFFVLSGYLITSILLREWRSTGGLRLGKFYLRRLLRLWPALLFMLLALIPWGARIPAHHGFKNYGLAALSAAGYVSDFVVAGTHSLGGLTHTWSLALEEQFYLVWPPILLAALTLGVLRRWLILAVAVLALAAIGCLLFVEQRFTVDITVGYLPWGRGGILLLGCLLALALESDRLRSWIPAGVGVGLAACAALGVLVAVFDQWIGAWMVMAGIATCGLIAHLVAGRGPIVRILSLRPFVEIGKLSYGIYLWHSPLLEVLAPSATEPHHRVRVIAAVLISVVAAGFSYWVVEAPFRRLKRRERVVAVSAA